MIDYSYDTDSALASITHPGMIDSDANNSLDADAVWNFTRNRFNQVTQKSLPSASRWVPGTAQVGADEYVSNILNQYTSVNASTLLYDTNGNLTEIGDWTYTYDSANRLTDADFDDGSVTKAADFVYDALDRRISKTFNDGTAVTTQYLWTGQDIIAEYDGSNNVLRRYVQGPGIDEPVAVVYYDGSGDQTDLKYFHTDHAGTVIALSNETQVASANVGDVELFTYSTYGEVGAEGTAGVPFRFTGRQLDAGVKPPCYGPVACRVSGTGGLMLRA